MTSRRGAAAPFALLGKPLFLQRDWDGTIRAFPNVCTHAWHTLVAGPERHRVVTCPQHGRQFDAAGRCLSQPAFDKLPGFPSDEDHLPAYPVEALGDLLFTCLGEPEIPFTRALAPVLDSITRFPVDALRRRPLDGEVRELAGNWKQHAWNYLDSLHIPFVHKRPGGLADAIDASSYRTELFDRAVLQWAFAREAAHGFDPAFLPDRFRDGARRVFALWWFVFPNLTLNFYPWGLSINSYEPVPGKPGRTLFRWYHHVLDEDAYAKRDAWYFLTDTDAEDVDALTHVARGVASGLAGRGRFAPGAEAGPHWFHRLVDRSVRGDAEGRAHARRDDEGTT